MHACVLSCFSCIWLCATLWTVSYQAPLSMGFSRQEYWTGLPCPPPGDLFDPGIGPVSPAAPALAGGFFTTSTTWKAHKYHESERKVAQLCPTLCDPMDSSPPGSSIHGILQARILECVAISFSRETSWPRDRTQVSCIVGFFTTEPPGKSTLASSCQ